MWPQTGNKSCSISLPCQSFKRVPGDVFVPPRPVSLLWWPCWEVEKQSSAVLKLSDQRRKTSSTVQRHRVFVDAEAEECVRGVSVGQCGSPDRCARRGALLHLLLQSSCRCSRGQRRPSLPVFHILLVRDGVEPRAVCVWSTAGGLLGANLISGGVCYRPRPLASQPVAKRKVFVFFCLFLFFSTFLLSAFTRTSLQSWDGDN